MRLFDAAKILARHGDLAEAQKLLQHLWDAADNRKSEQFSILCASLEVWALRQPKDVFVFLESLISGEGHWSDFWMNCSLSEHATLLEWHGQLAYLASDTSGAFESLSRAASLGRDTSVLWRLLASVCVDNGELELATRYARRSLQVFRQQELSFVSGREHRLGDFLGAHPLDLDDGVEDYLKLLLKIVKLAKGQKNLRMARELVMDLIHQYPEEERLLKVRLLMERTFVQASLSSHRASL